MFSSSSSSSSSSTSVDSTPPRERTAHHFDFDRALMNHYPSHTATSSHDTFLFSPHQERAKHGLRPGVIETFRDIWNTGHYLTVITNGRSQKVQEILKDAGLNESEMATIKIMAAESPSKIKSNFKKKTLLHLRSELSDVKHHYYYDDPTYSHDINSKMIKRFQSHHQQLDVVHVLGNDTRHLQFASGICKNNDFCNHQELKDFDKPARKGFGLRI